MFGYMSTASHRMVHRSESVPCSIAVCGGVCVCLCVCMCGWWCVCVCVCVCVCCFHLPLRDGGHSQGDGDLEVVDGAADPGSSVDRVVEVADVDGPHGHTDEGDSRTLSRSV